MKKINQLFLYFFILLIFTNCENQSYQGVENLEIKTETDVQIESVFKLMEVLYPEKYVTLFPRKDLLKKEFYTNLDLQKISDKDVFSQRKQVKGVEKPDTLLSIINFDNDEGFAIINNQNEIIALTNKGSFSVDKLTKEYTKEEFANTPEGMISYLINTASFDWNTPVTRPDTSVLAGTFPGPWVTETRINPLVQVKFHQNAPFNSQCYNEYGEICPAGCVAIAIIQIMSANKYPTTIGNRTYNWNSIIEDYKLSPAVQNLLAQWIRTIGDQCNMFYSQDGSGSSIEDARECFMQYPRYRNLNIVHSPSYEDMYPNLANNTPLYCRGMQQNSTSGHAWVIDGCIYQKQSVKTITASGVVLSEYFNTRSYVHCNWGWGGSCDGYYLTNVFNLSNGAEIQDGNTSSGESNVDFSHDIAIITYNLQ